MKTFTEALYEQCINTVKEDLNWYVNINRAFWDKFKKKDKTGYIIVEPVGINTFLNHSIALSAFLINRAKGYVPLFSEMDLYSPLEFFQSYISDYEVSKPVKFNLFEKLKIHLNLIKYKLLINKPQDILKIKFEGVYYGDIIYDTYLEYYHLATIRESDLSGHELFNIMKNTFKGHTKLKKIIKKYKPKATLLSHQIGSCGGILHRVANKFKLCSYLCGFQSDKGHLYKMTKAKEYQYTPTREEIENLLSLDENVFNSLFKKVCSEHFGGSNLDAIKAFSGSNQYFKTREDFNSAYKLDNNKKNIFIMLHAFNDHPHSHFDNMLFLDYYDWFIQTLEYAKKDTSVNWIVKRHPSDARYPCKDVNFAEIFKDIPNHIKFIDIDEKLDTRSLEYAADAVVTCIGSAGYELPALYALPSIAAGDNMYSGLDFSKNPKSKREYFKILSNLKNIEKISPEAQKQAKALYIFIKKIAHIKCSAAPDWTFDNKDDLSTVKWSLKMIAQQYETKGEEITKEMNEYIKLLSEENFKAYRKKIDEI